MKKRLFLPATLSCPNAELESSITIKKKILFIVIFFSIAGNDQVWQVGGGNRSTFLSTKPTAK
jgi:hypothetical protein